MAASAVSLVASSQELTRATALSVPSGRVASISATTIEMRAPGRSTQARTFTGATGMAPRMSSTSRPTRSRIRCRRPDAASSIAFVIRANGGEPCWIVASQLLAVPTVDSNT